MYASVCEFVCIPLLLPFVLVFCLSFFVCFFCCCFFRKLFSTCYHWWICFLVWLLSSFFLFSFFITYQFFLIIIFILITLKFFFFLSSFFLPFILSRVSDRVLVFWPGVRALPLRWESQLQDIGPPETSQLHVISNGENLPEISISVPRRSSTQ